MIKGRSWSSPGAQARTARGRFLGPSLERGRAAVRGRGCWRSAPAQRSLHPAPTLAEFTEVGQDDVAQHRLQREGGEQAVQGSLRARLVQPIERGPQISRESREAGGRNFLGAAPTSPRALAGPPGPRTPRRPDGGASSGPAPRRPGSRGGNRRLSAPAGAAHNAAPRPEVARETRRRACSTPRCGDAVDRPRRTLHKFADHLTGHPRSRLLCSTHSLQSLYKEEL